MIQTRVPILLLRRLAIAAGLILAQPRGFGEPVAGSVGGQPNGELAITPELLDQLVDEGQLHNPALQAAGAQTEAAAAAVDAVRQWEDPTASFGVNSPTPRGFKASEDGNLAYGVDQKLPLFGRPELMRKVAAADAARARLAADSQAQALRRDLAVALNSLALADRQAQIAQEDLVWLGAMVEAVDHRYRVGEASQVDWLKIQTAEAMADDEVRTKILDRDHGVFALNRLLNRDPHSSWPTIAVPSLQPPLYYNAKLVAAALAAEPELRVLHQESVAAQAAADLTHRQRQPDVSVGLEAMQYSGDFGIRSGAVTVNFTLPWVNQGRYEADWRRDRQRQRASELAAADYALGVRDELHHHLISLDAARRQALLYRDTVIPLTRQTLASAESAWEHNLGLFQDVLDARRLLLANQLALAQALTDQGTMLAEISYLVGSRDLGSLETLAGDPPSGPDAHLSPGSP